MKTNRIIIALAVAAIVAPSIQSCKKGENDPFLSFRSRKARVAGDWTVTKQESSTTSKYTNSGISTESQTTETYENGTISEHYVNNSQDIDTTYVMSGTREITFDKEGGFTKTSTAVQTEEHIVYNPSNNNYYTRTMTTNTEEVITGNWNFLSGVGEVKSKEVMTLNNRERKTTEKVNTNYVQLSTTPNPNDVDAVDYQNSNTETTTTMTETRNDDIEQWHLSQLKAKEILADVEINNSWKQVDDDGDVTESTTTGTSNVILTSKE